MRPRRLGAEEATGAGTHSTIGGMARAAPIRLSNSGEVRISVNVACTACWTAWAVAALTAAATDSLRASDRPSRIESNLSSWALNVLRVLPLVKVTVMVFLLAHGVLVEGDPARGRSGQTARSTAGRETPARRSCGLWR